MEPHNAMTTQCVIRLYVRGAQYPELLRSTKLRKQIGTLSQILNLKEQELDILANFMGHDIRIHREFYRLPEETIQVAKVSKLLLAMETGTLTEQREKTLDKIDLDLEEEIDRMALSSLLDSDKLNIPPPKVLPNMPELGLVPHFVVGDEAFPLKPYLMRPYPGRNLEQRQRLYNYRHCSARRVSENAFAILANKFRLYHRKLELCFDNADRVVLATCVLHNFIRKTSPTIQLYTDNVEEVEEVRGLQNLERVGHHSSRDGLEVREALTKYVNSATGVVHWQDERCFGHAR